MNEEHFITIKEIAEDIYSHKKMRDLPFERIIRDTVELMRIVKCPMLYEQKEVEIEIEKWRAALPCDFFKENQINFIISDSNCNRRVAVFKKNTGTFSPVGVKRGADLTYEIRDRVIYTSIPYGRIEVSYQALKVDDDGFPMIVNNESYIRALKSYIKMKWYTDLFDDGDIKGEVLQNAKDEYYFNIAQAQMSFDIPDLAEMENIAIIMNDAFTRQHEYYNNFYDLNKKHKLRVH